jgi:murein DD-endopeptidase MepM/ murein hydrolase activator NlpD
MNDQFVALSSDERLQIAWPTPNHTLFDAPGEFFARTRVNPDYGKPGWTRDCGKRFHRGCDIAPVSVTATGQTTRVVFTNCATNKDFESEEPTFVPHDDVFCVFDGTIAEVVADETVSDFGKHVVIEHVWPRSGAKFFTLYGHLAEASALPVSSRLLQGAKVGRMGQTSRSADARNWMAVAPHLHFEVRDVNGQSYDPVEFLKRFLPSAP